MVNRLKDAALFIAGVTVMAGFLLITPLFYGYCIGLLLHECAMETAMNYWEMIDEYLDIADR